MQSLPGDVSPNVKKEGELHPRGASPEIKNENGEFAESSSLNHWKNTLKNLSNTTVLVEEVDDEVQIIENGAELFGRDNSKQLVLYNPEVNGAVQVEPVSKYTPPVYQTQTPDGPRVLPSVGAFTVQCANCFKWRLIPTKEKYEEIRESILEVPFVCERARGWKPNISCDDPADISQDGSCLWAIDKPNIAQPPRGWDRELRIRGQGSSKFADIYYAAPSGKKLRSMVEVQKYLFEHPEHIASGVNMSHFSFQVPKPLQDNYVRKRTTPATTRPSEPAAVNPLAWAGPADEPQLRLGQQGMSAPYVQDHVSHSAPPAKKRKATRSPSPHMCNSNTNYHQPSIEVEKPPQFNSFHDL